MTRKKLQHWLVVAVVLTFTTAFADDRGESISLFDGETLNGWTTLDGKPITKGWVVEDGAICRKERGGHIFYQHELGDFEFSFEWKIAEKGNSGVKYKVRQYGKQWLGCEYQIYGDKGRNLSKGSAGALYALYEPGENKQLKPAGDWNAAKIVVNGNKFEHWLNGEKIVEATVGSDEWNKRLKASKFSPHADFAQNAKGRLMLQDHGSKVWFRNLVLVPASAGASQDD